MIIFDLNGIKGGEEAHNNDCREFHCDSSVDNKIIINSSIYVIGELNDLIYFD